jgi:hypothetical protein
MGAGGSTEGAGETQKTRKVRKNSEEGKLIRAQRKAQNGAPNEVAMCNAFHAYKQAAKVGKTIADFAKVISQAFGDPGLCPLVLKAFEFIAQHVVGGEIDLAVIALIIHVDYFVRTGKTSGGTKFLLSNKCSKCGLKGHNASNCAGGKFSALIQGYDLKGNAEDADEVFGFVSEVMAKIYSVL